MLTRFLPKVARRSLQGFRILKCSVASESRYGEGGLAAEFRIEHRCFTSASKDIGLFSIPHLQQPSDFTKLAFQAMSRCDSLRETLRNELEVPVDTAQRALEILYMLDSISKEVCNVIDAAELCRCVHTVDQWQESANHAFSLLSDYIGQLNADTSLFHALTNVTTSPVFNDLSEEQQRFASLLKAEFERDGIHLSNEKRDEVRQLQSHVVQLESLFQHNITNTHKYFDVSTQWVEEVIARDVVEANIRQSSTRQEGQLTLSTEASFSNALLRYSPNPSLRREIYMETSTACPENLQVLDALRQLRHEVSVKQGFESYADRSLRDKMAQNQRTVETFLGNLQNRISVVYKHEMEVLADAKRRIQRTSEPLEPWDIQFYTNAIKASRGLDANFVAEHLTLPQCIDGMKIMVKSLFGITMTEENMDEKERWDGSVPAAEKARKFVFTDESEQLLGTMYLDLHPRPGKYGHAAHFAIRCGCALGVNSTEYQLPVIALVCNLQAPQGPLSHGEVETLFHEFGHAIHSLLSRTTYQHVSGTRSVMDFVETPSHLIENFAWDPMFLKLIGRHHLTGEPIPDATIQLLLKSRNEFRAVEMQTQIVYARYDQALFGAPSINQPSSTELLEQLQVKSGIPHAKNTHFQTRFGHLITYGAGYYGYLWCQVFAGDIWNQSFASNSLGRQQGERLWKEMLIHGGARDPNTMLYSLLGREPSVDSFFRTMELKQSS
jgi:mitochondrial intermediate peptidase